jgi:hypothetical protein
MRRASSPPASSLLQKHLGYEPTKGSEPSSQVSSDTLKHHELPVFGNEKSSARHDISDITAQISSHLFGLAMVTQILWHQPCGTLRFSSGPESLKKYKLSACPTLPHTKDILDHLPQSHVFQAPPTPPYPTTFESRVSTRPMTRPNATTTLQSKQTRLELPQRFPKDAHARHKQSRLCDARDFMIIYWFPYNKLTGKIEASFLWAQESSDDIRFHCSLPPHMLSICLFWEPCQP